MARLAPTSRGCHRSTETRYGSRFTNGSKPTGQTEDSRYARKLWPGAVSCQRHNESRARALQEVETAAQALGVQLHSVEVRDFDTFDQAFAAMAEAHADALITQLSAGFVSRRTQIVDLAARMQLPGIYADRELAEAGGLMTYGPSLTANFRRAAT